MDCTYNTVEDRTTYTRCTHTRRTDLTDGGPGRGSIPRVGLEAATAAGQLPYPSRTRKISPPAFRRVLECASLWENCPASAGGQVRAEGCNRKYTQGPSRWNPRPSRRRPQLVVRRLTIHPHIPDPTSGSARRVSFVAASSGDTPPGDSPRGGPYESLSSSSSIRGESRTHRDDPSDRNR